MTKSNNAWYISSAGSGLSLTIKGLLLGLLPIAISIAQSYGVDISESEIAEIIEQLFGAAAIVVTLYGAIRRVYIKFESR